MAENVLYYGDNLQILRDYIKDETIDLIYLDPPFKSNQDYNVLFAEQNGSRSVAQIKAFEDTWEWNTIEELLNGKRIDCPPLGQVSVTFKKAPKAKDAPAEQKDLDF